MTSRCSCRADTTGPAPAAYSESSRRVKGARSRATETADPSRSTVTQHAVDGLDVRGARGAGDLRQPVDQRGDRVEPRVRRRGGTRVATRGRGLTVDGGHALTPREADPGRRPAGRSSGAVSVSTTVVGGRTYRSVTTTRDRGDRHGAATDPRHDDGPGPRDQSWSRPRAVVLRPTCVDS